jgi:hypothetical protein
LSRQTDETLHLIEAIFHLIKEVFASDQDLPGGLSVRNAFAVFCVDLR